MARPPPPLLLLVVAMGLGVALGSGVDLHKRIIGGQVCGANERGYHVQLEIYDGSPFSLCGGSLIRPQWILTAAHCANNAQTINAVLGGHPNPANAVVVQITAPPVIYPGPNGRNHDIMLLRLPNPAPARIPTVDLPNCQNRLRIGDRVQAAGHGPTGRLADNQRSTQTVDQLHCAEFEVVGCQRLRQILQQPRFQNERHRLNERWLCAQDPRRPPSVDTCKGDSGGGVVDIATRHLYGVLSFNSDPQYACTGPVAFMDVCEYIDWIDGEIGPPPLPPRPGRFGPPPLPPRRGRPGSSSGQAQGAPRRKKSRWDPAVRN